MTIRLLRTLVAVADRKTFSAAAQEVHVTHAAVSQQMQALEADLGLALFNRSGRTPELTPVAHQIVKKARQLIADYDNLVPSVLADGGLNGPVTLGALRTTLTGLTPQAMVLLKQRWPEMVLNIRPGLTATLLADIERGNLDAAIVTKPHLLPPGVQWRDLTVERMHLITSVEETEEDPEKLLSTRPFIRFNRNAVVGALIENWILARRIRVQETMELDSPEAISSMVQANLGVSIVPEMAVKPREVIPVRALSLGADAPARTLGLVYLEGQLKMQAVEAIHRAMSETIDRAQEQKT